MKRHFMKSLMALCAGVMTLVAASSLFVSCYDDSALREDINGLDKRLQTVEQLKTQLAELTARVDGLYTLSFQVTTDNKLQYSFDGKTWTTTDIVLTGGECDCEPSTPCQCVPCDHKCPEVSLVDNGETVTIKVGDAEFTIVKPEEIMFELRAGKLYFESEGTQKVAIKSSGIEDITVMAAPKGWWAEINSEGLVEITAPDYESTQDNSHWNDNDEWVEVLPVNSASGYVKVHACASDGKCMVGKLPVEVSNTTVNVKAYAGKAYFTATNVDSWAPEFHYGMSPRASFEADVADFLAELNDKGWSYQTTNEGQFEIVADVAELLGAEPEKGVEYVAWALAPDRDVDTYTMDHFVVAYYQLVEVAAVEDESQKTAYNVTVTVTVEGADKYLALAIPGNYLEEEGAVEFYKGNMVRSLSPDNSPMGKYYTESYTGSVLDIAAGTTSSMSGNYAPNRDICLLVLPIDGRSWDEYTVEDIYEFMYTTAGLAAGGSVNVTAVQSTECPQFSYDTYQYELLPLDPYTALGVKVTLPETGWTALYYSFMTADDYALYNFDDATLVNKLLEGWGMTPEDCANSESWPYLAEFNLLSASTYYFVAFAVDATGKYGQLTKLELTTAELEKAEISWDGAYTTNLVDGVLKNNTTFEFTPQLTEDVASYKYVWQSTNDYHPYENMDDAAMADIIYFANEYESVTIPVSELVDGKIVIEDNSYGNSYYFAVIPLTSEGVPGYSAAIVEYDCSFVLDAVITDFPAAEPEINFIMPEKYEGWAGDQYYWFDGTWYMYSVSCSVTPVEGTEVKVLIVDPTSLAMNFEYDLTGMTELQRASALWSGSMPTSGDVETLTEAGETYPVYISNTGDLLEPMILACWTFEGKYYYKEISLAKEFKTMLNDLKGVEESLPSPDGKQWLFYWEGNSVNAVLDFGVTMPGQLVVAYDPAAMGAPEGTPFQIFNAIGYEFVPVDETSGRIVISSQNMFGEISSEEYTYTNFTGTSCYFNFGEESFLAQDVDGELTEVTVDASGGIM